MLAIETKEDLSHEFTPANSFAPLKLARKSFAANKLLRARHFYVAHSLTFPSKRIQNSNLSLVRKLAWLLCLFQILDGIFTVLGIRMFGIDIEGNPLIKQIALELGPNLAIFLVKLSTILIILSICIIGCKVHWLKRALTAVAGIYLVFALLPWMVVFASAFV